MEWNYRMKTNFSFQILGILRFTSSRSTDPLLESLRLFRDEGQTSFVVDDDDNDEEKETGERERSRKSTKKL